MPELRAVGVRATRNFVTTIIVIITSVFPGSRADAGVYEEPDRRISARVERWLALAHPEAPPSMQQYAAFLAEKPAWPRRDLMISQFQKGLTDTTSSTDLQSYCGLYPPGNVRVLKVCAPYLADVKRLALQMWESGMGNAGEERVLLDMIGHQTGARADWARFSNLIAKRQLAAARRQAARLPRSRQNIARVMISLTARQPDAETLFLALGTDQQRNPDIFLSYLRWLRFNNRIDDAARMWRSRGFTVQSMHGTSAWARERLRLAYDLLADDQPETAFSVVHDRAVQSTPALDLDRHFLAGWIALRKLKNLNMAMQEFAFLRRSDSVISKARGFYWSARTALARGQDVEAHKLLRAAAAYPTTFYGQLALGFDTDRHHGHFLLDTSPPQGLRAALARLPRIEASPPERADLVKAARYLSQTGHDEDASAFLMSVWAKAQSVSELAGLARTALGLKLYKPASFAARKAGQLGATLYPEGWVRPDDVISANGYNRALTWAVARQESNFDPQVVSPSKAIGMMQLLVGTARDMARKVGVSPQSVTALSLTDPDLNMRLGNAYLTYLLGRFDNFSPAVLAAYNAGPTRARRWLDAHPVDADASDEAVLDWIETLPFGETRSYVQRVWENNRIYEAEDGTHD